MKRFIIILGISFLMKSCVPVRIIERPKITGYVFNIDNKKPIDSCNVNGIYNFPKGMYAVSKNNTKGVYTNSKGFYKIKKRSYIEFRAILACRVGSFLFNITHINYNKNDFYNDTIKLQESFGRKKRKGAYWKMDTVFLTKKKD